MEYDSKFYTYAINQCLQLVYALRKAKKPNEDLSSVLKEFHIPTQFAKTVLKSLESPYNTSTYSDDLSFESLIGEGLIRTQSVSKINDKFHSIRDFADISSLEFFKLDVSQPKKILFMELMVDNLIVFNDCDMAQMSVLIEMLKALQK